MLNRRVLKEEKLTWVPWTIFKTPSGKPASIANAASIIAAPERNKISHINNKNIEHSISNKITWNKKMKFYLTIMQDQLTIQYQTPIPREIITWNVLCRNH
jgi:hypothetical protein